jgi:hypothetical protein
MSELIYNVHEIFDSNTKRGCLQQHGCSAYRIPLYQRGYKWGSEINQPVERLLSDLKQAWSRKAKEYLLQAITVKKVPDGQSGWVLEVIDGQQRLTTLFILIYALSLRVDESATPNIAQCRLRYSIRHEALSLDDLVTSCLTSAQDGAKSFDELKEVHAVDQERHQDCYYLKCAVLRCLHELQNHSGGSGLESDLDLAAFKDFVFQGAKLMVNAVEAHVSGEVIFGNLNTNRVVLTETELIKGLLLTRVAREPLATRTRRYREVLEMRIRLGQKWEELNHWANLPEIRSLYFPTFKDGMMGLLELMGRQMSEAFKPPKSTGGDEKLLFEYFLRQARFEPVFELLSQTYSRLQDWYENDESYHLLGYCLIHQNPSARLSFLTRQLKCKTKSGFKNELYAQRRSFLLGSEMPDGGADKSIEVDFAKLRYGEDNEQIQSILLALSVFHGVAAGRFDFHAYEHEGWSLEHIFPQTPFGKGTKLDDAQKTAAFDVLAQNKEDVLTADTANEIARLLKSEGGLDREEKVDQLLKSEPLLHQIGNLCLLSSEDNSSMGCGMFNEKRETIRNRIARGSFVPRHTYEVFSKMIVGEDDSLNVWTRADIEKHQVEIFRRILALTEERS